MQPVYIEIQLEEQLKEKSFSQMTTQSTRRVKFKEIPYLQAQTRLSAPLFEVIALLAHWPC
jgi:hypothetical protein